MFYDYVCNNCGHEMIDVQQSIKDKAFRKCPDCNKNGLQRVIHGGILATIKKEPTTIGQLVEKCTKERKNKFGSDCDNKKEKISDNPHLKAKTSDVMRMTDKQKKKYIMEGRT